jgi:hypothetical protein
MFGAASPVALARMARWGKACISARCVEASQVGPSSGSARRADLNRWNAASKDAGSLGTIT